ncbi:MAG TPA: hypothetical protein VGM92_00275 [Candidatus Kapabacteria bacterium]
MILFGQKWDSQVLKSLPGRDRTHITAHTFSSSAKILALANNNDIELWDLKSHQLVGIINLSWLECQEMVFKTGDSEIVIFGKRGFPQPSLQNTKDDVFSQIKYFSVIAEVNLHSKTIRETIDSSNIQGSLSPDGQYFAELSDSGTLTLRTVSKLKKIMSNQLLIDTTTVMQGHRRKVPGGKDTLYSLPGHKFPNGILWFMSKGKKLAVRWYNKLMIFNVPYLTKIETFAYNGNQSLGDGIVIYPEYLYPYVYDLKKETLASLQAYPLLIKPSSPDSETQVIKPFKVHLFDDASLIVSRYQKSTSKQSNNNTACSSIQEDSIIFSFKNTRNTWGMHLNPDMHMVNNSNDGHLLLFKSPSTIMIVNVITHEVRKLEEEWK